MMRAGYTSEHLWDVGFQISWTRGEDYDTLEAAWTEEAISEAADLNAHVSVWAYREPWGPLWVRLRLPADPDAWESVTLHDAAEYTNARQSLNPEDAVAFDFEFTLAASPALHIIRHRITTYDHAWFIETPSERTAITFTSMPWPSSMDRSEFFANSEAESMDIILEGMSFDEDPFSHYVRWSGTQWHRDHYQSTTAAIGYPLQFP